jgi:hypothetical protein
MTDQSHAQTRSSTSTTTGVFAVLKAKPGVTRERVMAIMPAEIRATVQLYLDGKIRDWYSRDDGKGGVFLLNTSDVEEAKSIMEPAIRCVRWCAGKMTVARGSPRRAPRSRLQI